MAPVMLLSTVSQARLVAAPYQCSQGAPCTTSCVQASGGIKSSSIAFTSNCGLLSEERRFQTQFSSQALQCQGQRRQHALLVRSTRAELAADANIGKVITVDDADVMEKYIAESGEKLVVVDISTRTCGPCKLIFPKFVKLSEEYPEVLFLRINGDVSSGTRALMRKWGVNAVPNFRFYQHGKLMHSHVGAKEDELRAHFQTQYLKTINVVA